MKPRQIRLGFFLYNEKKEKETITKRQRMGRCKILRHPLERFGGDEDLASEKG